MMDRKPRHRYIQTHGWGCPGATWPSACLPGLCEARFPPPQHCRRGWGILINTLVKLKPEEQCSRERQSRLGGDLKLWRIVSPTER